MVTVVSACFSRKNSRGYLGKTSVQSCGPVAFVQLVEA